MIKINSEMILYVSKYLTWLDHIYMFYDANFHYLF